jgi:hypothetical protein
MFGGSLGLAGLYNSGGYSDYANSYALRAGFGLAPRLMFLVGFDGAWAVEANLASYQNIWYAGVQAFLSRQLFLRGGLGLGNSVREDPFAGTFADVGFGATGTIGYELIQGYNWSLEMAGVINAGFYEYERWVTYGMNLGINFF